VNLVISNATTDDDRAIALVRNVVVAIIPEDDVITTFAREFVIAGSTRNEISKIARLQAIIGSIPKHAVPRGGIGIDVAIGSCRAFVQHLRRPTARIVRAPADFDRLFEYGRATVRGCRFRTCGNDAIGEAQGFFAVLRRALR
jgi:hypothetical protein